MIYLNGLELPVKRFYGGELTALVSGLQPENDILWLWDDINGAAELFILQALMETMKEKGVTASLEMPYIPYARNDGMDDFVEESEAGEPVYRVDTLSALTKTINSLDFTEVLVYEPHSVVSAKLIKRCKVKEITTEIAGKCLDNIEASGIDPKRVVFIFPDGGAEKRYSRNPFYAGYPWVGAVKRRNPSTGELEGYNFFSMNESINNYDVAIIVDDICGRGGTYLPLAEAMHREGFKEVYLVVAHCENNIQSGTVLTGDLINKVYTTNSILTISHENLIVAHKFTEKKEDD